MSANKDSSPKWDVALAALATDEFHRKGAAMTLNDFRNLAERHAIRLDDIMETMFLLAINGEWIYLDSNGRDQPLDQAVLDNLYVKRRLSAQDLSAFDGSWRPA
jgi:hypothetical protein